MSKELKLKLEWGLGPMQVIEDELNIVIFITLKRHLVERRNIMRVNFHLKLKYPQMSAKLNKNLVKSRGTTISALKAMSDVHSHAV